MTQELTTNAQRIQALLEFGYTEREAAFLCLAALHGGYFLRRQYCRFIGKEPGGNSVALTDKLIAHKHASVATGCNNTKVFHLSARPFYAALGEADNRNRRDCPPPAIKNRLMRLDFVLANPCGTFLATETEKVDYFTSTLGIDKSALPVKRFVSQQNQAVTDRFFVDKYPILTPGSPAESSEPVRFCFPDEGQVTSSRFANHLREYQALFTALGRFRLVYIAIHERVFRVAERAFGHYLRELNGARPPASKDPRTSRMLAYFDARQLYERAQLESFNRAKLIQFRSDREEFSGPECESLYDRWKHEGAAALPGNSHQSSHPARRVEGTFVRHLLTEDYNLFGTTRRTLGGAEKRGGADARAH